MAKYPHIKVRVETVKNSGVIFEKAIREYIEKERLITKYEASFSWNNDSACLGVFDIPDDYIPFANGGIDCSPEYKKKPVLIAKALMNGIIVVEETEYTNKYMSRG